MAGRTVQVEPEIHQEGSRVALPETSQADSETYPGRLSGEFARRAAGALRALPQDQHRCIQRPPAHNHRLAGRKA